MPAFHCSVVTLFPELFQPFLEVGVFGRGVRNGQIEVAFVNPRDFANDKHRTVDDRPFGGGPGMVMKPEPLVAAIECAKRSVDGNPKVVYLSPQGVVVNQALVGRTASTQHLILVAGRYEGIDERVIELCIDEEWSIGDYVLSGGELPAMVVLDAVARLIPGVLGHVDSAQQDSFSESLLDCPHYTRPEVFCGLSVPDVLLSGDHKKIEQWRKAQAVQRTSERRPDLLNKSSSG